MIAQTTQQAAFEIPGELKIAFVAMGVAVLGALAVAAVGAIKAFGAYVEAKLAHAKADTADGKATTNSQNITALANQVIPGGGTGAGTIKGTGTGGSIPAILLPLLLLLSISSAGCATSEGYKRLVTKTYPVVADRLGHYQLTPEEAAKVQTLRDAAVDPKTVRYEVAGPAWEGVSPDYRRYVGGDPAINEQRRADWLETANIIDKGQAAELRYRQTLGLSPQP